MANPKTWQLINNCTQTGLVVIDASNTALLPSVFYYEQTLAQLKPSDTQASVPYGTQAQITLPDTHVDEKNNPLDYTIILADADTLFPVKLVELAAEADTYDSTTVSDADLTYMQLALTFLQTVTAYPSSDMANGYVAALSNKDPNEIDKFFKEYDTFKTLTIEAVHAVSTYIKVFPYIWMDAAASRVYYLYTSNDTSGKPAGKVTLRNDCPKPLSVDKAPKDFTTVLKMTDGPDISLKYSKGQFLDDAVNEVHKICLMGTFAIESQLTKDDQQTDTIMYLTGTVNGNSAFAISGKEPDPNDKDAGFYDILHPGNLKGFLDLSVYLITLIMCIQTLIAIGIGVRWAYRKARKLPDEDKVDLDKRLNDMAEKIKASVKAMLEKLAPIQADPAPLREMPVDNNVAPLLIEVKEMQIRKNVAETRGAISDVVEAQREYLAEVIRSAGLFPGSQLIMDSFDSILEQLNTITDPFKFTEKIADIRTTLQQNATKLAAEKLKVEREFVGEQAEAIQASQTIIDKGLSMIDENEEAREAIEAGDDFEIIEER